MSRPMTKYRCPEEEVNKHLSFLHFRLIKYSTAFGSPDVMWEPDVYRLERATLQLQHGVPKGVNLQKKLPGSDTYFLRSTYP